MCGNHCQIPTEDKITEGPQLFNGLGTQGPLEIGGQEMDSAREQVILLEEQEVLAAKVEVIRKNTMDVITQLVEQEAKLARGTSKNKRAQHRAFETNALETLGSLLERQDLANDQKAIFKQRNAIITALKELFADNEIMQIQIEQIFRDKTNRSN